jgi:uncharacterized protein YkwD
VSFALRMIKILRRKKELERVNSKRGSAKKLKVFYMTALVALFCSLSLNGARASEISVQKIIDLTNIDRAENGLPVLAENDKLEKAAEDKADDMVLNDYFSHNSPGGLTPWHWMEQEKYDYNYAGENLAMDFTTAEKMNEAWLASPTHRANILNEKYKDIGIAVKEGVINGHSTIDVVQMFGSGDRSEDQNNQSQADNPPAQKTDQKDSYYPQLPLEGEKKTGAPNPALSEPVITSPQSNELISQKTLEVVGRSAPKEKVTIWNNSQEAGQTFSDEQGWFHLNISMPAEGENYLKVEGERIARQKEQTENSFKKVNILVDRSKPQVSYHLWANGNTPGGYLLEASSDKPNCIFEIGGKTINAGEKKTAFFSVAGENLSTILKVEDQAGNKTAEQIVLANYYQGNSQNNIIEKVAQMMVSEKVFADDPGRGALKKNLGIAMADNNH